MWDCESRSSSYSLVSHLPLPSNSSIVLRATHEWSSTIVSSDTISDTLFCSPHRLQATEINSEAQHLIQSLNAGASKRGKFFQGVVISHRKGPAAGEELYRVRYEDGDEEELIQEELLPLLI